MRILWLGGSHPRHLYFVNAVGRRFELAGCILEVRENIISQPSASMEKIDRDNFIRHFSNRARKEEEYFEVQHFPYCPTLKVEAGDLNSEESAFFCRSIKPDVVLIFGCGLIKDPLFSALPRDTLNLHLGLSPRYRGSATLFWPFYFIEPTYAGCTFHYIVDEPDAGDIVHQVVPNLCLDDQIHDVGCKAVVSAASEVVELMRIFESKGKWKRRRQNATGKNFLTSDFIPEHLRVIYNLYDDDMVRHYLEGRLKCRSPKLFRQF